MLKHPGCSTGCVCTHAQSHLSFCRLAHCSERQNSVLPLIARHRSVCHLADAVVGLCQFTLEPSILISIHIKFNTCFEMCTRSKALPGDWAGGAYCKNTYHPSRYSTSNYLSPLAEPGELSTPAHCQPKERLWGRSRKED